MRTVPHGLIPPQGWFTRTYGAGQPDDYVPLATLVKRVPSGDTVSRWRPTWWERIALLCGVDVWLTVLTYENRCRQCHATNGLQPVRVTVGAPEELRVDWPEEDV